MSTCRGFVAARQTTPVRNTRGYEAICGDLGTSAQKCPKLAGQVPMPALAVNPPSAGKPGADLHCPRPRGLSTDLSGDEFNDRNHRRCRHQTAQRELAHESSLFPARLWAQSLPSLRSRTRSSAGMAHISPGGLFHLALKVALWSACR